MRARQRQIGALTQTLVAGLSKSLLHKALHFAEILPFEEINSIRSEIPQTSLTAERYAFFSGSVRDAILLCRFGQKVGRHAGRERQKGHNTFCGRKETHILRLSPQPTRLSPHFFGRKSLFFVQMVNKCAENSTKNAEKFSKNCRIFYKNVL